MAFDAVGADFLRSLRISNRGLAPRAQKRVRVRAMVIASGRSRLTTRPTVFIARFADAIRCPSCAEIRTDAKAFDVHSQFP